MATTLEIIRGLSQAAANAYDGGHLENLSHDGEARAIGLKREEGNPINDSRIMDGFGVRFMGNQLCITYQSDVQLKEVYANGFESEVESMIEKVKTFLQKEYKKVTGESISLSKDPDSEVEVIVQNTSRVRTFVQAKRLYNIGGLGDVKQVVEDAENPAQRDASFKSFLDQGGFGKRAPNDNRKKAE
jgi:hypothetical protein|tara:strand:+ start:2755 stop:3315 length:561 start_codon:yes stop_codon:yes gene_type:complete